MVTSESLPRIQAIVSLQTRSRIAQNHKIAQREGGMAALVPAIRVGTAPKSVHPDRHTRSDTEPYQV